MLSRRRHVCFRLTTTSEQTFQGEGPAAARKTPERPARRLTARIGRGLHATTVCCVRDPVAGLRGRAAGRMLASRCWRMASGEITNRMLCLFIAPPASRPCGTVPCIVLSRNPTRQPVRERLA
jgi:hypothetical protein